MPADSIASPKLSILMPAYNEEATIVPAVERVMSTSLPVAFELVVVDDGSSDRTASLLGELQRSHEFQLVRHATNKGKGAALLTALAAANGDVCTVLDADLELDPKDIAPMYRELLDGGADLVLG
ncbi:MAG TPA: glycosyltransferase family 2 protein, partial [Thermoanaerobaculia bacterium]|nr:glycosyltransferase family 2 protein [Thermoanaerobaculia bacterium]